MSEAEKISPAFRNSLLWFTISLALWCCGGCSRNEQQEKIYLTTLNGTSFEISGAFAEKAAAFIFLAPECPLSQSYTPMINKLYEKYDLKGVRIYTVFPGMHYSASEIRMFRDSFDLITPVLLDTGYALVKKFEAHVTPEAFLSDRSWNILYRGSIDNWSMALGSKRPAPTEHYLNDAIEAVISGRKIRVKQTEAIGCLIE